MKKKFFLTKADAKEVKKSLSNIENSALKVNAMMVSNMHDGVGGVADSSEYWRLWLKLVVTNDPIKSPCD